MPSKQFLKFFLKEKIFLSNLYVQKTSRKSTFIAILLVFLFSFKHQLVKNRGSVELSMLIIYFPRCQIMLILSLLVVDVVSFSILVVSSLLVFDVVSFFV